MIDRVDCGVNDGSLRRIDAVYVLITDPDAQRILMVQNDTGAWTLPGGMREPGETLEEAARREAREETGLDVVLGPVVHVSERIGETHNLFVTFRAEITGGTLGADLADDVRAVAWKAMDEAQRLMPWYADLPSLLVTAARYQSWRER